MARTGRGFALLVICGAMTGCAAFRGPCSLTESILVVDEVAYVWTLGCNKDEVRRATANEVATLPPAEI